jgi:hypothetical protein
MLAVVSVSWAIPSLLYRRYYKPGTLNIMEQYVLVLLGSSSRGPYKGTAGI